MSQQPKGVFNQQAHAEEVESLMRGKLKQFELITIDCSVGGYPQNLVTQNGLVEVEGNGLVVLPSTMLQRQGSDASLTEVFSTNCAQQLGKTLPTIYVKFNHQENPWLPLAIPTGSDTNPNTVGSYCLTFGRFWVQVTRASVGTSMYLLVTRGVGMYGCGFGPVLIGAYAPPTWSGLR